MANTSAGAVSLATIGIAMALAACSSETQEDQRVVDGPVARDTTAGQYRFGLTVVGAEPQAEGATGQ